MCYVLDKEVVAAKEGFDVWKTNWQVFGFWFPPPPYEQLVSAYSLLLLSDFPYRFIC